MSVKSKQELRLLHRERRMRMSESQKQALDDEIAENVLSLDEYRRCDTILVFVSTNIEVNTARIIGQSFKNNKLVAVPRCDGGTMSFYVIDSVGALEMGRFGILEPKRSCVQVRAFEKSVCIVPGLVYDRRGYRIGFGGGYYDRFLREYTGVSVGVCYSGCIEEFLPLERFDRPVDIIVSENKIIRKDNEYGL